MLRITVIIMLLVPIAAWAQEKTITITNGDTVTSTGNDPEGESFLHIAELSAMIAQDDDGLYIEHVIEPEMRAKGYEKTEVLEADRILMANGKKISGSSELKAQYEAAAVGSTFKLGLKRGDAMLIAAFTKADAKSLPRMRMMISRDAGEEDRLRISEIGVVLGSRGKEVVVISTFEPTGKNVPANALNKGDIVVTLNTFAVKSFGDFAERFEKIPAGDVVEIVAKQSGKERKLSFTKPDAKQRTIIRRKG